MRKEILKFFLKLFVLLIGIIMLSLIVVMPQYQDSYTAVLHDKRDRVESIQEPQIIIVGDSNVVFGIDSAFIENQTGMVITNYGHHGGIGQTFITEMLRDSIKPGDIIIVIPATNIIVAQNGNFNEAKFNDCVLAWLSIENDLDLLRRVDASNMPNMIHAFPTYYKRALTLFLTNTGNNEEIVNSYHRNNFNEYGDNIWPRPELINEEEVKAAISYSELADNLHVDMINYYNQYNTFVEEKDAILLMASPPIIDELSNINNIHNLQRNIEDSLNFPIISTFEDYVYSIDYYYDTVFHLNDYGKKIRSEQLAQDVLQYLETI